VANWVYRRPFDYRVWRTWILPSPLLRVSVSDTVTLLENVVIFDRLSMEITDSVAVAETIVVLLPVLFIDTNSPITLAEFVDINFGFIVISNNPNITETVSVGESVRLLLRLDITLLTRGLLTMKVGG